MPARTESALGDYLKQIKRFNLLTAEEERELGYRIRAAQDCDMRLARGEMSLHDRDKLQQDAAEARDRMIQANLRLVISVAKNFRNRGLPMEDLVNEGNVGLMNAVDRFDPDVGSRFSTYAGYWIDQAIRRAVQNAQQMIHIPSYLMEQIGQMRLAMRRLEESLGRPPTTQELAVHLEITDRKAGVILQAIRAASTRSPGGSADGENALEQSIADPRTPPPFEQVFSESDADFVAHMLERITDREALVLKLRYGLSVQGGRKMTLKEIGDEVGLTRERVRQIEKEAKRKLEEYVKEYL
ncbi:RNA polymerase sigma factor SigA [Phycisphaerae bacterium RAS1]|nr:RNA polymerase sigma factor SigA [Phycisphaerae bacterium RAS1]